MRRSLALLALLIALPAAAADVHVLISAGFFKVYSQLAPGFEKASGHRLVTVRGPSMGDSPEAIPARLARGEAADVVIMDGDSAVRLAQKGVLSGTTTLARSQIGMVVKQGAPKPDIGSVEAFRKVLLEAKSVAWSDSGSGTYLSTVLFKKLGVEKELALKGRKVRGPPSGEPVAAVVARGDVEIGFQQVSEVINVPGTTYVGPIPAELQHDFSFAGGVTANAREAEAGRALLRYLTSREAAPVITKAGLLPVAP